MVQGSLSLSTLLGPCVSQTVRLSVRPSVRRPPLGGNASSFFHSSRSSLFPRLMPLLQLVRVYTPTFLFFPLPICFLLLLLVWGNSFQSFHLVEDFFFSLVGRKETNCPTKSRVKKKSGNNMASFLLCFLKDGQLDATAVSPPPSHFDDFLRAAKRRRRKKKLQITSEICAPAEGAILERTDPQPAKNKSIQYRLICFHFCCDISRPVKWEKIFIV